VELNKVYIPAMKFGSYAGSSSHGFRSGPRRAPVDGEVFAFRPAQGAHRLPQRPMPVGIGKFRGQDTSVRKPGSPGLRQRKTAPI
jgi:hypothetical protein